MTDSVLSPREKTSNRLDPAHNLMLANAEQTTTPWMALAGRDPVAASDQMDRQTSELLAYVQHQNDEIDAKQAELNAKLAQLDNELRAARLRSGLDAGTELLSENATGDGDELDELPLTKPTNPPEDPAVPESVPELPTKPEQNTEAPDLQEFEEVEKLVAQITDTSTIASSPENSKMHFVADIQDSAEQVVQDEVARPVVKEDIPIREGARRAAMPFDVKRSVQNPVDSFPQMLTDSHLTRVDSGVDIHAMATSLDASELESERRLLAERKNELDRRKTVLQRMQDETQSLHREALEMRLVTEQLWIELSQKAPAEHVSELLASLRTRLAEDYSAQQKTINDRKSELINLKQTIERKQDDVREQSSKLQEWVESRHNDIKAFAAQVDAREMLLDRREHRMREEFSKWEAQRGAYQQQLRGLLEKLNLAGLGE